MMKIESEGFYRSVYRERDADMEARKIGLGHLAIGDAAKRNVMQALDENRLSSGRFIREFESRFAELHQRSTSVFTASGTCALQIALAAMKEKYHYEDGDEVIVPAITFVATANVVLQMNMKPVFVDVDPQTYNIDPNEIEKHVTSRTRAIIPVHLFGLPCDMDPIIEIADRFGLHILEDSCESMFVKYRGRSVGTFGEFACFSTYVAHLLVTGVGGLITMKDEADERLLRSIMQHGRDSIYLNIDDDDGLDAERLKSLMERRFSFVRMGYSYRVTELEGALGVAALSTVDEMMSQRQANAFRYGENLSSFSDYIQLPYVPSESEHAFMMYPLVLKGVDRDRFALHLEKNDVETRFMMPLVNQPYYEKLFGLIEPLYPNAEHINRFGLYIPCHHGMTLDDVDYVCSLITEYLSTVTS